MGIRKAPELTADNWKELSPVGLFASLAHAFSVLALGAGAVSFGQIVKAGEPVFAAATNALVLKDLDHPMVYLALLPIIGGVGDASAVYNQVMAMGTGNDVVKYSIFSGLAFYIYNEASFLTLSKLSPVTHSVANTLKRVVIIIASCIVFKTPMSLLGGIGSGIAVLGTLLYSLAKKKYSK